MTEYKHTPDMGEISGFGGGYEEACQNMLHAGVAWMIEKKVGSNDIKAHTFEGIYGLITSDNKTAEELEQTIGRAAGEGGCTGAMVQAVMTRCIWIASHSWEEYCKELRWHEANPSNG